MLGYDPAHLYLQIAHDTNNNNNEGNGCWNVTGDYVGNAAPFDWQDEDMPIPDDYSVPSIPEGAEWEEASNGSMFVREGPDSTMRDAFKEYLTTPGVGRPFLEKEVNAINLLSCLRKGKSPLTTYDDVMRWHFACTLKGLTEQQKLSDVPDFVPKKSIFDTLRHRYGMSTGWNISKPVLLCHSQERVNIVINDVKRVIVSLLTDPRIVSEDYLLDLDNPFAPPPEEFEWVEDINTGRAYRETYKRLVTDPENQILLPIIMYTDACVTGQFANLSICSYDITLGIFNQKAREKPFTWRSVGYIPKVKAPKTAGTRALLQSGHVEEAIRHGVDQTGIGNNNNLNTCAAQDYHQMLSVILDGYRKLQEQGGFVWDFVLNGILYEKVQFIPYVAYVKCDIDEADKLCGAYTSRGRGVKQLCRCCTCPASQSDNPLAHFELKTVPRMQALRNNDAELKNLSQQNIDNAYHSLKFGQHSQQGIHGATPLDMLHIMLLGTFKMLRDCVFAQIGESSAHAKGLNALAALYGSLLHRQSDRRLPITNFTLGVKKGKLMAKEFRGVLLVLLCSLCSRKGQEHCRSSQGQLREITRIADWIMVLETVLQWEQWLKKPKLKVSLLDRAERKHKYLMYLIRKVAARTKGMGLKLIKFHYILHFIDDIKNHGTPAGLCTGKDEERHKARKIAAVLTQKQHKTFDSQTEKRMQEVFLLELAQEELRTGWAPFDYYNRTKGDVERQRSQRGSRETPSRSADGIRGMKYQCFIDDDQNYVAQTFGKKRRLTEHVKAEKDLIDFVIGLEELIPPHLSPLYVRTEYVRGEQIFRANSFYYEEVWRDWAMVDWGAGWGVLPAKFYGFVDLSSLPANNSLEYGGLDGIEPSIYGIAESAAFDEEYFEGPVQPEMIHALRTEVAQMRNGHVAKLKLYLVDVETIVSTAIVVPNIGGDTNGYFWISPITEWSSLFEKWLKAPYEDMDEELLAELRELELGNYSSDDEDEE